MRVCGGFISSNASWYISWRVSRPRKVTGLIYHLAVVSYPSPFQNSDSEVMPSFSLPFQIPTRVPMHSVNRAYHHCVFRFPPNQIPGFRLPTLFFIYSLIIIIFLLHGAQSFCVGTQPRKRSVPFPYLSPNLPLHFSVCLFIGGLVTAQQWLCCVKSVVGNIWRRLHHLIIIG